MPLNNQMPEQDATGQIRIVNRADATCPRCKSKLKVVARKHNRIYVGLELNLEYIELARERTREIQPELLGVR